MQTSVLDQTTDRGGHLLYKLAAMYELPESVKQASDEQRAGGDRPKANGYADEAQLRFPCHTKVATHTSWVYFLEQQPLLAETAGRIERRLQKMAAHWGLEKEVERLRAKHASLHQDRLNQLPDSAFAIVRVDDTGRKEREYPLRNTLEVKSAAEWLHQYCNDITLGDRRTIARKVLEKAAHFGADLSGYDSWLERQAGFGWCDPKQACELLRNRLRAVNPSSDLKAHFNKLAEDVSKMAALVFDNDTLNKLCEVVDQFDDMHGIKYSSVLPRPEDVLFQHTFREVRAFQSEACRTTSGSLYEKEQFAKLSLDRVRGLFGDELIDQVSSGFDIDPVKFADVAATFPRPDAELLDTLMREVGEPPLGKEAAHRPRMSFAELEKLAATI